MPYRFGDTQLRVVHSLLSESSELVRQSRFVILEHILPTTAEFVRLLADAGADVFGVIAKPYSVDEAALEKITATGIKVLRESDYATIEGKRLPGSLLRRAQEKSAADGRKIVIVDVGGYFADALIAHPHDHVVGVVEDTTFGHNIYTTNAAEIGVPIVSVARSDLKRIEARFVGRDAVASMDKMLREVGISISGRNALVVGYGMIGSNVARTLRSYDLKVFVYDKKDTRNLQAHADGFSVHTKRDLLKRADIIFAATGSESVFGTSAISYADIEDYCKDNVVLASVGSRKSEFDIVKLKKKATGFHALSSQLIMYRLSKDENVVLAMDGSAVNFHLPSIPIEVLDLVFSEIVLSAIRLLGKEPNFAVGGINQLSSADHDRVAKDWLRLSNQL